MQLTAKLSGAPHGAHLINKRPMPREEGIIKNKLDNHREVLKSKLTHLPSASTRHSQPR